MFDRVKWRHVNGLAATVLLIFGVLCFANIVNVAGRVQAVVEFYDVFDPEVISFNFPGTDTAPTIVRPGDFIPEILVKMDTDTIVDLLLSEAWVDGSRMAVYTDHVQNPGKVYGPSFATQVGDKRHFKFQIVFKRLSDGSTIARTVEGYVQGGDVKGTWYLNQYDLSSLTQYQGLKIPLAGAVTLKFVATEGASFLETAQYKIWKHRPGIPVEDYESYYAPDWTVTLSKVSDNTWTGSWTPQLGTFIMYGYVNIANHNYRQLAVIPTIGGGEWGLDQWIGIFSFLIGAVWLSLVLRGGRSRRQI